MSLYEVSVKSNKGKIRDYNQDNFAVNDVYKPIDRDDFDDYYTVSEDRIVLAVFDGVGGLKNGEIASGLAAKIFTEEYHKDPMFICEDYLYSINRTICDQSNLNNTAMGTTAVICEIKNDKVRSINIGDSRAYLFDGENILQISKDHAEKVGFAKSYDVSGNERKHTMLTQYLGISEEEFIIEPYVSDWFDIHNNYVLYMQRRTCFTFERF